MTTTSPEHAPLAVSPNDARRLVAAALHLFTTHWIEQLDGRPLQLDTESVKQDIALADVMATSTTGWTHTTRLREFLDAKVDDYRRPDAGILDERAWAQREYDDARAAHDRAQQRLDAASNALLASQCRVKYGTSREIATNRPISHYCTLAKDHPATQPHGKYDALAAAAVAL